MDALTQYVVVPDDLTGEVPNPLWAWIDAQLRQAQAQWNRLQAEMVWRPS